MNLLKGLFVQGTNRKTVWVAHFPSYSAVHHLAKQ